MDLLALDAFLSPLVGVRFLSACCRRSQPPRTVVSVMCGLLLFCLCVNVHMLSISVLALALLAILVPGPIIVLFV